jgi:hypothetical protein
MMFSAPRLETLELLDVGAHLWVGSALVDLLRTRSKTLRFLALRLNHQPDHPGVLDNIFEVSAGGGAPWILDHPLTHGDIIDLPTCGSTTRSPGPHFTTFLRPEVVSSLPDTPPRIVDGSTHRVFWHRGARRALGEGSGEMAGLHTKADRMRRFQPKPHPTNIISRHTVPWKPARPTDHR